MKLFNIMYGILVMGVLFWCSGCASYLSYQASENEIYKERIYASGNTEAIKMVSSGMSPKRAIYAIDDPGTFGLAIDLTSVDVLGYHPWRQLGAAILDACLAYGGYLLVDELGSDGDSSNPTTNNDSNSRDTTVNVNNADNTTININGDTTSSSTEIGDGNTLPSGD